MEQSREICRLVPISWYQYLSSNISSTERDVKLCISKYSYGNLFLSDYIKWEFFLASSVSELLYGCTTWTLAKYLKKKNLDQNDLRMLLQQLW